MKVFRSVVIDAPIERVWRAVRAFDGVVNWNPAVTGARMESGSATSVGAVRHLDIVDGGVFRETLLAHSDLDHYYTYDILESPLPVTDYVSTHRFIPITDGERTLGIWQSEFNCPQGEEHSLNGIVGDQIYVNAMRGLSDYLKENH